MEMMNTWCGRWWYSCQPNLEEENVFIDVLHEGDKTNEDSFNFHFNVSDLY